MRVSVVLATHNGARFLGEQLESISAQTRPVDEVIVGDDASTDATPDLLHGWAHTARRSGTEVSVEERAAALGVIGNFADLLARATGDVIFFADQDDVWHPEKVQRVLKYFDQNPGALAVFTDAELIDGDGRPLGSRLWSTVDLSADRLRRWALDPLDQQLAGNRVTGATLAVRSAVRDLALPMPERGYHDGWIALLLTARGPGSLVPLDEPLVRYRLHTSNASGGLPPVGPFAPVWWYLRKGHVAERLDLEQLPAAVGRLRELGISAPRVEEKAQFMGARRALPRGPVRRYRWVVQPGRDELYARYTPGRLAKVLDVAWYSPRLGRIRGVPSGRRSRPA